MVNTGLESCSVADSDISAVELRNLLPGS